MHDFEFLPYSNPWWPRIHNCQVKAPACHSSPPCCQCGPDAGSNVEALWGKDNNCELSFRHRSAIRHKPRLNLTLCDAAAKAALEAAPSFYELHVRTHVGLAAVAANWTILTVVHQVCRALGKINSYSLVECVTTSDVPMWIQLLKQDVMGAAPTSTNIYTFFCARWILMSFETSLSGYWLHMWRVY